MAMDIVTYGNTELLGGVLEAVSYMFYGAGTADLKGMMVVVGGVGFIMALIAYAFQPQKLVGWYWLATVLGVSTVLYMPKTDVQILDRLQACGAGCVVVPVKNVPYALALVASMTSKIGDGLTTMFETSFQGVVFKGITNENGSVFADTGFRGNGMMFGNKLIRAAARSTFPDIDFRYNMTKYIDNCAGPDMSDDQAVISVNELRMSTDMWKLVLMKGGNPARYTPTYDGGVMSCDALKNALDLAMEAQIVKAKASLAERLGADSNSNGPNPNIDNQISQTYLRSRLQGDVAANASAMIRQNAMINAMADAKAFTAQRTNDPTSMMMGMAEAQAKISTNSSWITGAKIAEEAMPLIRNGLEAILFASFPIILLMCLLVTGKTCARLIGSYAMALLWIQMWPPLYAVLNFMASAASAKHVASAGLMPGVAAGSDRGLSLLTSASIYENTVSDLAVVGYLVASVPVFAWALVKGMEAIAGGAIAGAAAYSAGSGAAASEASTGSVSLGQTRAEDIRLGPSYTAPDKFSYSYHGVDVETGLGGSTPLFGVGGSTSKGFAESFKRGESGNTSDGARRGMGVTQGDKASFGRKVDASLDHMDKLLSKAETGSSWNETDSHKTGAGITAASDTTAGTGDKAGTGKTATQVDEHGNAIVNSSGYSEGAEAGAGAGANATANAGVGTGKVNNTVNGTEGVDQEINIDGNGGGAANGSGNGSGAPGGGGPGGGGSSNFRRKATGTKTAQNTTDSKSNTFGASAGAHVGANADAHVGVKADETNTEEERHRQAVAQMHEVVHEAQRGKSVGDKLSKLNEFSHTAAFATLLKQGDEAATEMQAVLKEGLSFSSEQSISLNNTDEVQGSAAYGNNTGVEFSGNAAANVLQGVYAEAGGGRSGVRALQKLQTEFETNPGAALNTVHRLSENAVNDFSHQASFSDVPGPNGQGGPIGTPSGYVPQPHQSDVERLNKKRVDGEMGVNGEPGMEQRVRDGYADDKKTVTTAQGRKGLNPHVLPGGSGGKGAALRAEVANQTDRVGAQIDDDRTEVGAAADDAAAAARLRANEATREAAKPPEATTLGGKALKFGEELLGIKPDPTPAQQAAEALPPPEPLTADQLKVKAKRDAAAAALQTSADPAQDQSHAPQNSSK